MKKKKKRFVIKKCIVCGRKFLAYAPGSVNHHHGVRGRYLRPSWSRTCSPLCSREFTKKRKLYLKRKKY